MPTYAAPGVYVEEVVSTQKVLSAAPTAVAAFVGFTERFPTDDPTDPEGLAPRLITSWTQFENLYGSFTPGRDPAALGVRVLRQRRIARLRRPGAEHRAVRRAGPTGTARRRPRARAADRRREPRARRRHHHPGHHRRDRRGGPEPVHHRRAVRGQVVESFPGLTLGKGKRNVATVVNDTSTKIKINVLLDEKTDLSGQLEVLKPGLYSLEKATPTPVPVTGRKFAGSESARQGINGLAVADDVTMVVVPDLVTAATKAGRHARPRPVEGRSDDADQPLRAERQPDGGAGRAARDDPAADPGLAQRGRHVRLGLRRVVLPVDQGGEPDRAQRRRRGVHPAERAHRRGVGPHRRDPRGLEGAGQRHHPRLPRCGYGVTQNEQSVLNPIGINCIRPFGTRGIRIWGARTLASDSDWRYINVRRLFNMVETTIPQGTQWAVFEPNDVALWEGIKRTLNAFLRGLWSAGALVRPVGGPGVLRQVRRGDQPAGIDRPGTADRRGRHRAGQAGRVRRLPDRAAQADRQLTGRVSRPSPSVHPRARRPQLPISLYRSHEHAQRIDQQRPDRQPELLPGDRRKCGVHPVQRQRPGHRDGGRHHGTGRGQRQGPGGQDPGQGEQGTRPVAHPDGAAGHDPGQALGLVQRHPGQGHGAGRPHEQPQERLDRDVRLDQRRDRQVQLHQRLAVEDLHRPAVRRIQRPGERDDHPHRGEPGEGEVSLTTQYEFTLPRGYVDRDGGLHRTGSDAAGHRSGRAGAAARSDRQRAGRPAADGADPGQGGRQTLGDLSMVTPHEIEGLFAADLAFLQDFYGVINFGNQEEYEALLAAQAESAPLIGVPAPARGSYQRVRRSAQRTPARGPTLRGRSSGRGSKRSRASRSDPRCCAIRSRCSGRRSPTWPTTCTGRWTSCWTWSTWTGCGWCAPSPA